MKNRAICFLGTVLTMAMLLVPSCGPSQETTTPTSTPASTPPPTTAPTPTPAPTTTTPMPGLKPTPAVTEKPQYGGTFTFRLNSDPTAWDPYFGGSTASTRLALEGLGTANWMGTDPKAWDFKLTFINLPAITGVTYESWETTDWQTYVVHIRKGIRFQNTPPVNGRELTAYDVEYSFQRMLGLGYGYTKPSTFVATLSNLTRVVSVNATDKYTVVFKMKEPTVENFRYAMGVNASNSVIPREAVEKWKDINTWDRVIGSGPFMLTDYVAGSSVSFVKNPNYWGYDEKYPENRLPYVDKVKFLIVPDKSTSLAALRTGKIDMMDAVDWESRAFLNKTNPQLLSADIPGTAQAIYMRIDRKPYNDIRVRRALQMAIDLETVAKTYYGGVVSGTPVGLIGYKGYRSNYNDWPQEVKDGYAYNPERAKKLLAEAGFPSGFKPTLTMSSTADIDLFQIVAGYWSVIGVDAQFQLLEPASYSSFIRSGRADMSPTTVYRVNPPLSALSSKTSTHNEGTQSGISDSFIDGLYAKVDTTLIEEEQAKLIQQADLYIVEQQWTVNLVPTITHTVYHPWVKGYKDVLLSERFGIIFSRLWIDQVLKKSMGR